MGSKEGVAAQIEADTKIKIIEMNTQQEAHRPKVVEELLNLVYDLKPELHRNFALQLRERYAQ